MAKKTVEYPHESGDVIVLGPDVIMNKERTVVSVEGQNFYSQKSQIPKVVDDPRPRLEPADGDVLINRSEFQRLVVKERELDELLKDKEKEDNVT